MLAAAGIAGAGVAVTLRPVDAAASASQDYPAFVLVAGLLLIGLVADDEGLFAAAGRRLAAVTGSGLMLFAGAAVVIGVVTATLNLDISVAFLTPVLVYAARSRAKGESALLYGCLRRPCWCWRRRPYRCSSWASSRPGRNWRAGAPGCAR